MNSLWTIRTVVCGLIGVAAVMAASDQPALPPSAASRPATSGSAVIQPATSRPSDGLEVRQVGKESAGVVRIGNLVYASTRSSRCFSEHFLAKAERESTISTSRRLHAVKLGSKELFEYPMVVMTGEGAFTLRDAERDNLRKYCEVGGMVLASAGCSSAEWDRSFRMEMRKIFPAVALEVIGVEHPIFHLIYEIPTLRAAQGQPAPLEALSPRGRPAIIYSRDGLNDTAHANGCCCCGGNEIINAAELNINILAYALMY